MTILVQGYDTEVACPYCGAGILAMIEAVAPKIHLVGKAVVDVRIARLWCDHCGSEFEDYL